MEWATWETWAPDDDLLSTRDALTGLPIDEQYKLLSRAGYPVFSGTAGENPHEYVRRENRPNIVGAICARTEVAWTDKLAIHESVKDRLNTIKPALKPTFLMKGLDGNIWFIFQLETPMLVSSADHWTKLCMKFYDLAGIRHWLDKWSDGFSKKINYIPHPGKLHIEAFGKPITAEAMWECATEYDAEVMGGQVSTLDKVREQIKTLKMPLAYKLNGRELSGAMMPLGAKVPLWFLCNDYNTSAWEGRWMAGEGLGLVRAGGVQVPFQITLDSVKAFYTWVDIFGPGFGTLSVDQKEEKSKNLYCLNGAIVEIFDGKDGRPTGFVSLNRQLLESTLRRRGVSSEIIQGEEYSEKDDLLTYIKEQKRINSISPMPYRPFGIYKRGNTYQLNNSPVQAPKPAAEVSVWGKNGKFATWSYFFDNFIKGEEQQKWLLMWLKWAYEGFLTGKPEQGHALFIEGDPNSGKSLFMTLIAPLIFGANPHEPSRKLFAGDQFSKEMFETSLLILDDKTAPGTVKEQQLFTGWIKKLVASVLQSYRAMWNDETTCSWIGRIIIGFNGGGNNRDLLPRNSDNGIKDKWASLMTQGYTSWGLSREQWKTRLTEELPYFLAWLMQMPYEEWATKGADCRFKLNQWQEQVHVNSINVAEKRSDLLLLLRWWMDADSMWDTEEWVAGKSFTNVQLIGAIACCKGGTVQLQGWTRKSVKEELESLAMSPDKTGVTRKNASTYHIQNPKRIKALNDEELIEHEINEVIEYPEGRI